MKFKVFFLLLLLMLFGITANAAEDRYIIKFNDSIQLFDADGTKNNKDYLSVSADELQDYLDAGVVEYYCPDLEVELFAATWNLDSIKLDFPHMIRCYGTEVKIGVIDSGITEGIFYNILPGYNYIDKNTDTSDDEILHGTRVSAIAAYSPFGVAVDAKVVPLKCFRNKKGSLVNILDAIVDAVDVYDCDVINMSFGISEEYFTGDGIKSLNLFKEKIDYAVSHGAILIAAVGNDESEIINYPAALDNVIGVGSVNESGQWSDFSNYNHSVYVVAPGEKVVAPHIVDGALVDGYIVKVGGTSFSAPHVSGLAAIAKCIDKDITQAEFAQLIADTAVETEADEVEGWDKYYGYGLIDCEAAIKKLIEGQKVHIAPIRWNNSTVITTVYNNMSTTQKTYCICVYYDESGRMVDCVYSPKDLEAYEAYDLPNPRKGVTVKYMVLSNDGEIMPLADAKEK